MTKGKDTKLTILEAGLGMASLVGLEQVTIGLLAKETSMSKSGLFAHFQSKENLQIEILKLAADMFTHKVVVPALKSRSGIPRIKALVNYWIDWTAGMKGNCIFVSASNEFSDRPGKVRDYLLAQQREWNDSLEKVAMSAVREGEFREDMDMEQFAFDLYSLLLGFHYYDRLLRDSGTKKRQETALENLLEKYKM